MKTYATFAGRFACLFLTFGCCVPANATTLLSNLGQPVSTSVQVFNILDRNASDFMTGSGGASVTGLTVSLLNQDTISHTLTASIFTDNAGAPGSLVGTFDPGLSVSASDAVAANHTTTSSGITLAPNTPYWLVLGQDQNGVSNYVNWMVSGFATTDPGSGFSTIGATQIMHSANGGSSYTNAVGGSAIFELTGVVPEPGRFSLVMLALAGMVCIRRRS